MSEPHSERSSGTIEVPAPTPWPFIAACGVTLLLSGLLTHVIVSAVGLVLAVSGGVGWFRDVLPRPRTVPLPVAARRPAPVAPAPRAVTHLDVGELKHRARLPLTIYPYSAGLTGGIAGGIAMAIPALLYGLVAHGSVWYPVNLLAATASDALSNADATQLAAFSAWGLLLGAIIHVTMSLLVGLVYGVMLPMFPRHPAFLGGIVGPLLWTGVIWAVLGVVNPTLNDRIDWPWFVASQIAFGLAAGFVVARAERIATFQHAPLAVRAGIEATGLGGQAPERDRR